MRTLFWCSILSAALATGACKKSQDDTGKAGKDVQKTAENGDSGTNDLLTGTVLRCHEMQVWFVAEHLVETPLVKEG